MTPDPTENKDKALEERAISLIKGDATLRLRNLSAAAQNGVLRLTGEAATTSDRDRAVLLAGSVKGVSSVADDLKVVGANPVDVDSIDSSSASDAPAGWREGFRGDQ